MQQLYLLGTSAVVAQLVEHVIGEQNCPSFRKRNVETRITVNIHDMDKTVATVARTTDKGC